MIAILVILHFSYLFYSFEKEPLWSLLYGFCLTYIVALLFVLMDGMVYGVSGCILQKTWNVLFG